MEYGKGGAKYEIWNKLKFKKNKWNNRKKLEGKEMNVKKLCRRENNEEDHGGVHLSGIQFCHCLLSLDPPLVMPDGVLVWPYAACSRLQAIPSLWLSASGLAGPHCSTPPAFHQPRVQKWFSWWPERTASASSTCLRRVGILCHPWGALFSQGTWWECFSSPSPHILVCPRFFPIMYGFWWISCFLWGANLWKRGSSLLLGADSSSI